MSDVASRRYLTADEAGEILRVGPFQVVKLCRSGELRATKPGRQWLIEPADLDAYLAAHSNVEQRDSMTA